MRLLLAEDEKMMADAIITYLSYNHHQPEWASNGLKALEMAQKGGYDCLILDVMMPGMDGFTVLENLRAQNDNTPAIFLTAKGELSDKAEGFHAGGDDYLTKPFAMEELLMRVNALARRNRITLTENLTFSDLTLNHDTFLFAVRGNNCPLSPREFQLMEFLIRNPKIFFSADTLLDRVWGRAADVEQSTVWVHISQLRKKLEAHGSKASIVSKRSIGYALEESK